MKLVAIALLICALAAFGIEEMGYQERLAGPHTQRVELKQQQDKPDKKQSAEQDDGSVPYLTILNMILVLGQGVIFYLQLRVMGRIVGIYGQQANTMDRQADIANSQTEILRQQTANSIATDRALVWLRKMRMTPIVHPGFTTVVSWAFQPIWENSGDTATRRGLNHINWELFRKDPPKLIYLLTAILTSCDSNLSLDQGIP